MAQTPYDGAGPQVAPDTRPPDDYSRLDVRPDQFGAGIGQGLQQLGQGIEQDEKFHGQVAASDATNAYESQATKLLWGDPSKQVQQPDGTMGPDTGFFGLRGDAAMRARPQIEAQLDQLQQQGGAGLPSPESKLQFDSYTRRLRTNLGERVGQYTEQQAQTWRAGVNESTADLARQRIATDPEDPEALQHGLSDLINARVKEAQVTSGGDLTMMRAAEQRARGEGATTQVEALLNRNPTLAKSVLENSRGLLPPDTYDRLVNRLRPQLAGDQASEAIERAADGKPVEGGPVMHTPPAGGSPTISDVDALAAEKRLSAGTGTDADRALRATYVAQQNTPPGQQSQVAPTGTGLPQEGPMPPARGDGGPAPSADAGTVGQPSYQAWRATQPAERQQEFDRLAQTEATKSGTDLAGGQAALFDQLQAQAVAKGVTLPGAQTQPAAPTTPVTSPRHADFVSGQQLKAAEAEAQIRDRKPVLSDADKAADAADQQLIDRYKASHGIPRTTGIDIARLPDDPPQAVRDTSPDPVPHPDTHVLPSHPHVDPGIPGSRVGALPAPVPGGPAVPFFAAIGAEHGISGNYLARTKQIESGSGSGVGAVSSSGATGPFQFTRDTARRMGLVDPNDLRESADAAARLAAQNKVALTRSLGRAPDDADLYLAHQQGSGGASKLLTNPNVRAGDLVGDSAIRSNGGDPNAPASAFTTLWRNKFNGIRTTSLPSFATGFGAGQPYYDGAPGPGVMPPLPSAAPLPDSVQPAASMPSLMQQAPGTPPTVSAPPAAPMVGQVPPAASPAGQPTQPLPPPVAFNADDPSSPLPDRGLALAHARAMAGGDPIQARMNVAEVNRRYEEQNRETYTERMELQQQLPDLNAAASAGVDGVTLPERDIRRLFPPAKAQAIIGEFHANQAVGGLMRGVQWASPDQLQEMQRDISSGQGVYSDTLRSHRGRATTGAGTVGAEEDSTDLGYFRRRETAARQVGAEIQRRTNLLVGPEADPAAYVATNPAMRQANAAGGFEGYATASLGLQSFLGVPEAQQHVLTRGQAIDLASRITASPDPKAELQRQATAAGGAWPHVFKDAIALGKLPAGYQAVQVLDDPHDAALLSRTLASEKPGPDGKPAKSIDDTVDLMGGAKGEAAKIRDAVRFDPEVKNYVQSIQKSGSSADQVQGIVSAVETLALAKRGAGEAGDSASAASAAVKSFFGKFDYMPNGGARVPSKAMDTVSTNARATIDGLALDHIAVPERFGQPGQPEPHEYLDTVKAAPTWITSPKSDAIWLMDYAGRVVRGRDGQPVAVPFNAPPPAPAASALPDVVPGL